jgi:ribosomal protein S18 acetylase RimI-like enzyme
MEVRRLSLWIAALPLFSQAFKFPTRRFSRASAASVHASYAASEPSFLLPLFEIKHWENADDILELIKLEEAAFGESNRCTSFDGDDLFSEIVLVAKSCDGVVLGGVQASSIRIGRNEVWYASSMVVGSAWRNRGLGGAILEELLTNAEARGVVEIFLHVDRNNNAAWAMYSSAGFEEHKAQEANAFKISKRNEVLLSLVL